MNAFKCFKISKFSLGEHAPQKRPPRKGVLMGPLMFIVSILTSWLLETSDFRYFYPVAYVGL